MQSANDNFALSGGADRRQGLRRRTLMSGKIAHMEDPISFDCTIYDLSDGGARISIPNSHGCPDEHYLIIVRSGVAHLAQVAWRSPLRLGVRFLQRHDLGGAAPIQVMDLRRLWLELRPR